MAGERLLSSDTGEFLVHDDGFVIEGIVGWITELVDSADGAYCSLADIDGVAGISYVNRSGDELKYAEWNGSSWDLTVVDDVADSYTAWTSLVELDDGNPGIAYIERTSGVVAIRFATYNGSTWSTALIDSFTRGSGETISNGSGRAAAMVGGEPAVLYYQNDADPEIYFALYNGSSWDLTVITTGDDGASASSTDTDGGIYYTTTDGSTNAITYGAASSYAADVAADGFGYSGQCGHLVDGVPAFVYQRSSVWSYAELIGGSWDVTDSPVAFRGERMSLTDYSGEPAVAKFGIAASHLEVAIRAGGSWSSASVDSTASSWASIAMIAGILAVAYHDGTTLRYAILNVCDCCD